MLKLFVVGEPVIIPTRGEVLFWPRIIAPAGGFPSAVYTAPFIVKTVLPVRVTICVEDTVMELLPTKVKFPFQFMALGIVMAAPGGIVEIIRRSR